MNGDNDDNTSFSRSYGNFVYQLQYRCKLYYKQYVVAVFIISLLILIQYHWIYVEDAPNVNGASFEIGSGTRLANDMDAKMASTEDSGLPEGAQNVSRSVISQNNIDDGEDIRPKILLMGLRR